MIDEALRKFGPRGEAKALPARGPLDKLYTSRTPGALTNAEAAALEAAGLARLRALYTDDKAWTCLIVHLTPIGARRRDGL
jgi:hypothetical protein